MALAMTKPLPEPRCAHARNADSLRHAADPLEIVLPYGRTLAGMGKGCSLKQSPRRTPLVEAVRDLSVQPPKSLHVSAGTDGHESSTMKQSTAALVGANTPHEMLPLGVENEATGPPPYVARLTELPALMKATRSAGVCGSAGAVGEGVEVAVVIVESAVGLALDEGPGGGDSGEHPASTTMADSRTSPALVRVIAVLPT
jgi:hypothetical protein